MFGLSAKAIVITGALCFVAGSAAATAATVALYEKMIVPGRERAAAKRAEGVCLERSAALSQAAAAEAVAGEMARRSAAIDAALETYRQAAADNQAAAIARIQTLEEETQRYADELRAKGKSCPLDDDGMRFLGGVRD